MVSLPRIITIDPSGNLAPQVRATIDLMDRLAIQIDIPSANAALEELGRGKCRAVIAAWQPGDNMQGWELAAKAKNVQSDVEVIIIADADDTELDDEIRQASPFVYMRRPFDTVKFMRLMEALLDGGDLKAALADPVAVAQPGSSQVDLGPIPRMNIDRAQETLNSLLADLNAMAILLAARDGELLLERGTIGDLDRHEMTRQLLPAVMTNIHIREMIGGNAALLQSFDGENYDVFVLSVGLHHFLIVIFDGQLGQRQFGAVSRFGRRAAEDLIALLGAEAWLINRPVDEKRKTQARHRSEVRPKPAVEEAPPTLERAHFEPEPQPVEEFEPSMEAISDLDLDLLFAEDGAPELNLGLFDDLDALSALVRDENQRGMIDDQKARELGLLDS